MTTAASILDTLIREWRSLQVAVRRHLVHRAAVAWARAAIDDPDLVVLDCETTGLFRPGQAPPRIVELALLDGDGRVLIDTLIDPRTPIPPAVSALHGITDAMVATAPAFADIRGPLETALRGRRLVIFNAAYDMSVLAAEMGLDPIAVRRWEKALQLRVECVMTKAAAWRGIWDPSRGGWRSPRLGNNAEDAHRAASDCRTTLQLLAAMAADDEGTDLAPVRARTTSLASTRPRKKSDAASGA